MTIDFKEIPLANTGVGNQDTFELFARDFLEAIGYEIITNPTRGADNGKDLIIKEIRKGVSEQKSEIRWLVSCKHNAHSGKSVTPSIEQNIYDRVISNNCEGFIGFYSTLPSEQLTFNLNKMPFQIFDSEKIEKYIVGYPKFNNLFMRYFPYSYAKWKELFFVFEPIKLFDFYFKNKYPEEFNLFKRIFDTSENIYVALKNSNTIEEFVMFKGVKIKNIDIDLELDFLHKKYNDVIKKMSYSKGECFIRQIFFHEILTKENMDLETPKISGHHYYNNGTGRYILSSNLLIINEIQLEKLIIDYEDLKNMIN